MKTPAVILCAGPALYIGCSEPVLRALLGPARTSYETRTTR